MLAKPRLRAMLTSLGVFSGLAISTALYYSTRYDPVRVAAWERVTPRISEVEEQSKNDVQRSVEQVRTFFAERRRGAHDFASDLLSFGGKWAYVKDFYDEGSHNRFIEESFARNLFGPEELSAIVESAVSSCVSKLEGRENQLLVDIRADLSGGDMASPERLPALLDDVAFRQQYEAMLVQAMPIVSRDLGYAVTQQMVAFVGSEIAAQVVMQIATTIAVRLGISGGILGAGAYSGTVTFGTGLIVGILVDMALDWAIRQAGYDPQGEIAAKVIATLDRLESNILDGPPASDFPEYPSPYPLGKYEYHDLVPLRGEHEPAPEEKERRRRIADQFIAERNRWFTAKAAHEDPGSLGLQNQLNRLHEARSRLREVALKRLILEGGAE